MDTARTAEGQLRLLDRLSGPGAAEPEVEGA